MEDSVVATNRKARHDYDIIETIEAGLVLRGSEVKSLRAGQCSLQEGFAIIREGGEATLRGVHIAPYKQGGKSSPSPDRDRRLLLHHREAIRLASKIQEKGYTLVPLKVYFTRGYAKVEIGLAKGRKLYDKRQKLREEDDRRRTDEVLKRHTRG